MDYSAPRSARVSEIPAVIELVDSVFRPGKRTTEYEFPFLFSENNVENLKVICNEEGPVSHIGITINDFSIFGYPVKVGSLGSVCTAVEHRKKGLATKLFNYVEEYLREKSVSVIFISGQRGLYKRNNCDEFGIVKEYDFSQSQLPSSSKSLKIKAYSETNLEDVLGLYLQEPVRFLRNKKDMEKIVEASINHRNVDYWTQLFLIEVADAIRGYMLVDIKGEKNTDSKWAEVIEYAGNRGYLISAITQIKEILGNRGINKLLWAVPHHETELRDQLDKNEIPCKNIVLPGHTIKIIDFPRFMNSLSGLIREKITGELSFIDYPGRFVIRKNLHNRGRYEECSFSDLDSLHAFIFGLPGKKSNINYEGSNDLFADLNKIFPLPTIIPGMNYI